MTIQDLYNWAKKNNLLNAPLAKHFNFQIADVRDVVLVPKEVTNGEEKVVID